MTAHVPIKNYGLIWVTRSLDTTQIRKKDSCSTSNCLVPVGYRLGGKRNMLAQSLIF